VSGGVSGGQDDVNAKQLWQSALERVRTRVSAASYTTWFKATEGVELRADALVVAAPNSFAREHLRQRFHELAVGAVEDVLGRPLDVEFVVLERRRPEGEALTAEPACQLASPQAAAPNAMATAVPRRNVPAGESGRGATRHERRAVLDAPHAPPARSGRADNARWPAQPALLTTQDDLHARYAPTLRRAFEAERMPPQPSPLAQSSTSPTGGRAAFGGDLNPRYVFDTFVVGTANRLAYAAAQQVAALPGQSYNPLFIYGGTGLGKTHLLHAIGHVAHAHGLTVCYVPAERFANDIIEAIRHHTTETFRAHYRQVDVLLVDDIQFIAGKETTEEEFFHTFNALHDANRQIVLSSDRTPRAMHHLHDRLRSRFEWGLMADIQPPDAPHRLDILRAKAATLEVEVPEPVLAAIARHECASVRELEGALTRVLAYAEMLTLSLDADVVGRALTPLRAAGEREVTGEQILSVVAEHFGVSVEALRGKARDHAIAWPRQVAMYLLREETTASLGEIGRHLGGRDHTTVMHGCAHVSREVTTGDSARQELDELRARLRG
jgi:chromosomal replication initiator protein